MQHPVVTRGVGGPGAGEQSAGKVSIVRSEAAPFLIALVAGLVCYGIFFRRGIWLSVVGFSVSSAERVLNGEVPYRDFLYNYTPGMLWLNASLMKLFGPSLFTISAAILAFKVSAALALYYVARRLTSSWMALVPVGLTLAWIGYKHIFGIFPTQYSMLFILLGLACLLRFDETGRNGWLLLCGGLIGVVFVFKYNVGILLAGTGAVAVAIREIALSGESSPRADRLIRALKRCAVYWAGFAAVAVAMALYLAYNNALAPMIDHFFHHVSDYGDERSVPLPQLRLLGPAVFSLIVAATAALVIIKKAPRFYELFLAALILLGGAALLFPGRGYYVKLSASASAVYLPIFLFLAVAAWLALTLRTALKTGEGMSRWWTSARVPTVVGLIALGAFLEIYPRADFYHIVRALPPVFLLLAVIMYRLNPALETFLSKHISQARRASLLTLAAPLVLLAATGVKDAWQPQFDSQLRFIERTPLSLERTNGLLVRRKQAEMIEALANAIEENSSPGDSLFSFDKRGTGFYFLTGRKNPTRFVWWISVGLKQEDRAEVLDKIEKREIKLILLQDRLKDRRVREAVTNNYDLVRSVADIGVYRKREP